MGMVGATAGRRWPWRTCLIGAAALAGVVACGDDGVEEIVIDPAGADTHYVIDRLIVPTNATLAGQLGFVLDGNPQDRSNNALGHILSYDATLGWGVIVDAQAAADAQLAAGGVLLLARVKATSLTDADGVGLWLYLGGDASPAPCDGEDDLACGRHLEGNGHFSLDPTTRADARIKGRIVGDRFVGGPGIVTIDLPLGREIARLELHGARIDAPVTATTIGTPDDPGRLGGAILERDVHDVLIPVFWAHVRDRVEEDCAGVGASPPPCGCAEDSKGSLIVDVYDEDEDCAISLHEFRHNSLTGGIFAPDVDLFDASGAFNPRKDGVNDSLSLGVGFTAVRAVFDAPVDPEEVGE